MHCPFCNESDTKVIDSRLADEGGQVRRRRECIRCTERFTTYEVIELNLPRVIKRDGSRVSFNIEKLRDSFLKALEKRPVTSEKIDEIMNHIIRRLRASGDREISTQELGEYVMQELKHMDQVAYVRFASVYRSFKDVSEFHQVIEKLRQE